MINKFFATIVLACAVIATPAIAETEKNKKDPFELVQVVAKELFERIASEQDVISQNPEQLRIVVSEQLVPSINHKYAAAMVLGKYHKKTTPAQRQEFFDAFKKYLVATYAGILTLYKDQQVVFEPASSIKGKKIVLVRVRVLDQGRPDINIDFKLRKSSKTGNWSAYDMIAEGVSVLDSKRAELQSLIRQQGIESVTALLLEKAAKPIKVKTIG